MSNEAMRRAFEGWCKFIGRGHVGTELPYQGLHLRHDGSYNDALIQGYWSAWQAATRAHEQQWAEVLREVREALHQILHDGEFIVGYRTDETPIFTSNPIREMRGGSFCGAAGMQAVEALKKLDSLMGEVKNVD